MPYKKKKKKSKQSIYIAVTHEVFGGGCIFTFISNSERISRCTSVDFCPRVAKLFKPKKAQGVMLPGREASLALNGIDSLEESLLYLTVVILELGGNLCYFMIKYRTDHFICIKQGC